MINPMASIFWGSLFSQQHVVALIKVAVHLAIPDSPKWVRVAQKREFFFARAILEGLADPAHYARASEKEVVSCCI